MRDLPAVLMSRLTESLIKVSIEKSILALVVLKVVSVGGLVYIGLVGPGGFYREVLGRGLAVVI